jgi:RND superfamily putative drug exporter
VLVDALLIRSLLVPALMHLLGPANWALPRWLGRVLPRLAVEAPDITLRNQSVTQMLHGGRAG